MHTVGFKIIDKDDASVFKILAEAKSQKCPIEIGFYGESQLVRDYCSAEKENIPLNIHFDHRVYTLAELENSKNLFIKEVQIAKEIGAEYGVHHMAKYPMTQQAGYQNLLVEEVLKRMLLVEAICEEIDFPVYVENTFESIDFYKKVFDRLKEHATKRIHFCFDIGHAKVWSGDSFHAWMDFLKALKTQGFKLHFHLHANRGLMDEHLSLIEMEVLGFDGKDHVFSDINYTQMLKIIFNIFPEERKIFEVKTEFAIENRDWIKSHIF